MPCEKNVVFVLECGKKRSVHFSQPEKHMNQGLNPSNKFHQMKIRSNHNKMYTTHNQKMSSFQK